MRGIAPSAFLLRTAVGLAYAGTIRTNGLRRLRALSARHHRGVRTQERGPDVRRIADAPVD